MVEIHILIRSRYKCMRLNTALKHRNRFYIDRNMEKGEMSEKSIQRLLEYKCIITINLIVGWYLIEYLIIPKII